VCARKPLLLRIEVGFLEEITMTVLEREFRTLYYRAAVGFFLGGLGFSFDVYTALGF
jgi:hypothetical protein